jgi:hypothetical protein
MGGQSPGPAAPTQARQAPRREPHSAASLAICVWLNLKRATLKSLPQSHPSLISLSRNNPLHITCFPRKAVFRRSRALAPLRTAFCSRCMIHGFIWGKPAASLKVFMSRVFVSRCSLLQWLSYVHLTVRSNVHFSRVRCASDKDMALSDSTSLTRPLQQRGCCAAHHVGDSSHSISSLQQSTYSVGDPTLLN